MAPPLFQYPPLAEPVFIPAPAALTPLAWAPDYPVQFLRPPPPAQPPASAHLLLPITPAAFVVAGAVAPVQFTARAWQYQALAGPVFVPPSVAGVPPLAWAPLYPVALRVAPSALGPTLAAPLITQVPPPVVPLSWSPVFPSALRGPRVMIAPDVVFVAGAVIPPPPAVSQQRDERRRWNWHRSYTIP